MKYQESETKGIWAVYDESGQLVADTFSEELARQICALPELLELLDAILDISVPFSYGRAEDLQMRLKKQSKHGATD